MGLLTRLYSVIAALGFVLACSQAADAKTLCVNPSTGSDATTYAANTDPGTCWATLGRATWGNATRTSPNAGEAAAAGDTVNIYGGTYTYAHPSTDRFTVLWNPVNEGSCSAITGGTRIVFNAVTQVTLTYSSGTGPAIGTQGKDCISWTGPWLIDSVDLPVYGYPATLSGADSGPIMITGGNYILLDGLTCYGDPDHYPQNNIACVYQYQTTGNTYRNMTVAHVHNEHDPVNAGGIFCYACGQITYEHNTIFDTGTAISLKSPDYGDPPNEFHDYHTIRYNLMYENNIGVAIHNTGPLTSSNPVKIYQNIIRDGNAGWHPNPGPVPNMAILWKPFSSDADIDARFGWAVNNTIDNVQYAFYISGFIIDGATHKAWNNIVSNVTAVVYWSAPASNVTEAHMDFEHNLGFTYTDWAAVDPEGTPVEYTLAGFKAAFSGIYENAATAGQSADPLYVNSTTNDFHLQGGSPALNAGVDTLDLDGDSSTVDTITVGAYVTGDEIIGTGATESGGGGSSQGNRGKGRIRMRGKELSAAMDLLFAVAVGSLMLRTYRRRQ